MKTRRTIEISFAATVFLVQIGCDQPAPSSPSPTKPPVVPPTTTAEEFVDPPQVFTEPMLELQSEFKYSTGAAVAKLAEIAVKADKVIFYEGLPHQEFEWRKIRHEITTKAIINLHEYPFYAEPLEVDDADLAQLTGLLKTRNAFRRFEFESNCGGYHPDYAVEFRAGSEIVRVLFCFGCGEAKIYSLGIRSRHELAQENDLKAILKKYRKNRPEQGLDR